MMNKLEKLKKKLAEVESSRADEDYSGQTNEYRLQIIIEAASEAADELIMEGSDGSVEETDFLTSAVAQKMNNRVHQSIVSRLLRKMSHVPHPSWGDK